MEKRIGFGRRFGAYAIDIVFVIGISFILWSIMGEFLERFIDWSKITDEEIEQSQQIFGNLSDFLLTMSASVAIAAFLYNIIEGFTGYTLGKLMLGIQIGNQNGTKASANTLMVRFALKNISTLFGLIGMVTLISAINTTGSALGIVIFIGCFFALGEKKLALHDLIAKTAIYRKSELEDGTAQEESPFE